MDTPQNLDPYVTVIRDNHLIVDQIIKEANLLHDFNTGINDIRAHYRKYLEMRHEYNSLHRDPEYRELYTTQWNEISRTAQCIKMGQTAGLDKKASLYRLADTILNLNMAIDDLAEKLAEHESLYAKTDAGKTLAKLIKLEEWEVQHATQIQAEGKPKAGAEDILERTGITSNIKANEGVMRGFVAKLRKIPPTGKMAIAAGAVTTAVIGASVLIDRHNAKERNAAQGGNGQGALR